MESKLDKKRKMLKILSEIENIIPSNSVYEKISDMLREVITLSKESGDKNLIKYQWEAITFDFYVPYSVFCRTENRSVARFVPLIETNKGKYPDSDTITEQMFEYYYQRAKNTKNIVLEARYLDILWEFKAQKLPVKDMKVLDVLIKSQFNLGKLCEKYPKSEMLLVDSYYRTVSLCLKFNYKKPLEDIVKKLNTLIYTLYDKKEGRWVLDLADIILMICNSNFRKIVTDNVLKLLEKILNKIQNDYKSEKDFHLQRETLNIITKFAKFKNIKKGFDATKNRVADSFIEEAESKIQGDNPSYLAEAHFYELAMREYMNIGNKEKAKILKSKIREAYSKAQNEFIPIEAKTTIPQKAIDEFCEVFTKLSTLSESLKKLGTYPTLIPNVNEIKKEAEKQLQNSIATRLCSITSISGDLKVADNITNDDRYKWQFHRHLMLSIGMYTNLIISKVIDSLCKEKGLSAQTLIDYFEEWGLMDPENLSIIEIGLERYFAKDYVSAIYILTPQFESSFRRLLLKGGIDVTSFINKKGRFKEKTLGDLLSNENEEVKKVFGENLVTYIKVVMTEPTGLNLRNNVAHGLLPRPACTRELADIVLHLFLTLTGFTIKE